MVLVIYEDYNYNCLYPLNLNKPSFLLEVGTKPLYQKILSLYQDVISEEKVFYIFRKHLHDAYKDFRIFDPELIKDLDEDVLFVNGCSLINTRFQMLNGLAGVSGGNVLIFSLQAKDCLNLELENFLVKSELYRSISQKIKNYIQLDINHIIYPYHLTEYNPIEISKEFSNMKSDINRFGMMDNRVIIIGETDKVILGKNSVIFNGVTIDTRKGPVIINEDTEIKPYTFIEGPCYIGKNSSIDFARVKGSSIFNNCKISGEIEKSVISSYTNKHHDGFIGHSYIGSFVNLGAMATNSDLKNNYSEVRISQKGIQNRTGLIKVGCFIGDHSKLGIGSLINTGTIIGFGCNLYFDGSLYPKEISSFSWGGKEPFQTYDFDTFIDNTKKIAARRNIYLSNEEIILYKYIYDRETKTEV